MKIVLGFIIAIFPTIAFAQFSDVKKGDILSINGVKGIVFKVDDTGEHGSIMSVQAFRCNKNMFAEKSAYLKDLQINSKTDGKQNTLILKEYADNHGLSISCYPLLNWCNSLGQGWYIPATEQLKQFVNYWLGNDVEEEWEEDEIEDEIISHENESLPHKKKINKILLESGGIPFLNGVLTSTMNSDGCIDVFNYNRKKDEWEFVQIKSMSTDERSVGRAFYDF